MKKNNKETEWVSKLAMISQLGILMLTAVFICTIIGYFIDRYFGTKLMVFFIVFGVISGFWAVLKTLYRLIEKEKELEKKKRENDKEWIKKAFGETFEDKKE